MTGVQTCALPIYKDQSLYDEQHSRHAVVCFSNYYLDQNNVVSSEEMKTCVSRMKLLVEYQWGVRKIQLYAPEEGITLFPASTE